jgi:hypothetical protein
MDNRMRFTFGPRALDALEEVREALGDLLDRVEVHLVLDEPCEHWAAFETCHIDPEGVVPGEYFKTHYLWYEGPWVKGFGGGPTSWIMTADDLGLMIALGREWEVRELPCGDKDPYLFELRAVDDGPDVAFEAQGMWFDDV